MNNVLVEIPVHTFLSTGISISVGKKIGEIERAYQRVSTCELLILSNSFQKKLCQAVFLTTM